MNKLINKKFISSKARHVFSGKSTICVAYSISSVAETRDRDLNFF